MSASEQKKRCRRIRNLYMEIGLLRGYTGLGLPGLKVLLHCEIVPATCLVMSRYRFDYAGKQRLISLIRRFFF